MFQARARCLTKLQVGFPHGEYVLTGGAARQYDVEVFLPMVGVHHSVGYRWHMSSAHRTSCLKALLVFGIVLFWFSTTALIRTSALISKETRVGLLDVVRWGIVFGGVNVAAAWAALGPGTSLLRQLRMAIVTGCSWAGSQLRLQFQNLAPCERTCIWLVT